jgi:uncharacterized protein (TIGR03435 family)
MLRFAALVLLTVTAAAAQTDRPTFEVASVRSSPPGQGGKDWGPPSAEVTPGSLTMRNTRLVDLILWAYDVQQHQIVGPAWLEDLRFDIRAKAASAAPESELRLMLQSLLAERLKMTSHRENREMSVLILTVGKNGHKLQETTVEGSPSFRTGPLKLIGEGAPVSKMTEFLSRELKIPFLDQTGLQGKYNYTLDINAFVTDEIRKSSRNGAPMEAPAIIGAAVREQLGLKLDSSKASIPVVVIDHIEKEPTEN